MGKKKTRSCTPDFQLAPKTTELHTRCPKKCPPPKQRSCTPDIGVGYCLFAFLGLQARGAIHRSSLTSWLIKIQPIQIKIKKQLSTLSPNPQPMFYSIAMRASPSWFAFCCGPPARRPTPACRSVAAPVAILAGWLLWRRGGEGRSGRTGEFRGRLGEGTRSRRNKRRGRRSC
jgi:hypothetical protein